jgi:hypothetical protein
MKKKTKKLVLAKETIRSLEHSDLQRAIGQASGGCRTDTCSLGCPTGTVWYACWGTLNSCNTQCTIEP